MYLIILMPYIFLDSQKVFGVYKVLNRKVTFQNKILKY